MTDYQPPWWFRFQMSYGCAIPFSDLVMDPIIDWWMRSRSTPELILVMDWMRRYAEELRDNG